MFFFYSAVTLESPIHDITRLLYFPHSFTSIRWRRKKRTMIVCWMVDILHAVNIYKTLSLLPFFCPRSLSLSRIVASTISICVDVCYISICLFFVVAHCHSIYLLHVLNDFSSSHLLHRFVVSISICFFLRFVCGSFLNLILPLHEMGTLRKLRIIHPRNYIHIEARDIVHTHLTREKKAPWNISSPSLAWYCKCQPFFAHWW